MNIRITTKACFRLHLLILSVVLATLWPMMSRAADPAAGLVPAFAVGDFDVAHCTAYVDGREKATATADILSEVFGLKQVADRDSGTWKADSVAAKRRDYRIAFTHPVELGTICTRNFTGPQKQALGGIYGAFISVLKPDAKAPGDVTREDDWIMLPQGNVKTLPPGTKTAAIRFTTLYMDPAQDEQWGPTVKLTQLICFRGRAYNLADSGVRTHTGGKKENTPDVWIMDWEEAKKIVGVALFIDYDRKMDIGALKPDFKSAPALAENEDWLPVMVEQKVEPGFHWYPLAKTLEARTIRLQGLWANQENIHGLFLPLALLGESEQLASRTLPPPPFALNYEMPYDGVAALEIHDKQSGRLVRRLIAETMKNKGAAVDNWDLKDENGTYVGPGDYTWKAFVRPPFKLTYEMSVNNAGQPAWWAPPPGKGGGSWLGDHGTPNCAALMGKEMLWFGTLCAENGNVAIATDLEGNKLWGTQSIAEGFRGPAYIACDDKAAYLMCPELIQRVVPGTPFKMRRIFNCKSDVTYPWHPVGYDATIGGAAARDGKLYWAINAPSESWLVPAFLPDAIEPGKCIPGIGLFKGKGSRQAKGDKNYGEGEYDELMKLYGAFLLGKTPQKTRTLADTGVPSSTNAWFGDAPSEGDLAGSVVVTFNEPITVGSVLVPDGAIRVFALKAGKTPADYLDLKAAGELQTDGKKDKEKESAGALSDLDDAMAEMKGEDSPEGSLWVPLKVGTPVKGRPMVWAGPAGGFKTLALRYQVRRLAFSQVMTHRLQDCAGTAKRICAEGKETEGGGWHVERGEGRIVTPSVPAVMALVWPEQKSLRGLSFTYPLLVGAREGMPARFYIDAWKEGPGDPATALADDSRWERVGEMAPEPVFQGYFPQDATCRSVDFGRVVPARAVRVTVSGGVEDRAGFASVVAWTPIGEDPKGLPVAITERITVLKLPAIDDEKGEAQIEKQIPLPRPGQLAFDAKGTLFAISDGRVVTVPLTGDNAAPNVIVPKGGFEQPRGMALDSKGFIYVVDAATHTIKVFDPATGKLARTIGKGPEKAGTWDPATLDNPMQIAVDPSDRLWVSDASYQPKRVQRFAADGKPDRSFLGPTEYGGGGWLDERDVKTLYYNGMRFRLDWDKRDWKLDSLVSRPDDARGQLDVAMPDRVVYFGKHRYLVGPPWMGYRGIAVVSQERGEYAIPRAVIGELANWGEVGRRPDLRAKFGDRDGRRVTFLWCDKNNDGQPQVDEVQTSTEPSLGRCSWVVGEDLSLYTVADSGLGYILRPSGIADDGTPSYNLKNLQPFTTFTHGPGARTQNILGTDDGRIFMIGTRLISADGKKMLWEYYNNFACHEGFYLSQFGYDRPPGVLNQEHKPIGHFKLGDEEYFFTNTDEGDWFCFTGDGMFAGCVFGGPKGSGLRRWTMPDWTPGKVDLSDVRLSQEHYQGCVVKTPENKVYAVAGHNHISIVRVDGLEQAKRLSGSLQVTVPDLEKTRAWDVQRQALARLSQERKSCRVPYQQKDLESTGNLSSWPKDMFARIHTTEISSFQSGTKVIVDAEAALAYNERYLFVGARVLDNSPLRNTAKDPSRLFQGGDAFDLTLSMDPKADPKRTSPVAGDLRVLLSVLDGKPIAVLYKPVAPDAPVNERARFESPVGLTIIEQVKVLPDVQIGIGSDSSKEGAIWTLTARIPWSSLGVKPPEGETVLRGDLGVLVSDPNGVSTATRWYWSGKSQTVVCDVPSETRLIPALWGELHFGGSDLLKDGGKGSAIEQGPGISPDDLLK